MEITASARKNQLKSSKYWMKILILFRIFFSFGSRRMVRKRSSRYCSFMFSLIVWTPSFTFCIWDDFRTKQRRNSSSNSLDSICNGTRLADSANHRRAPEILTVHHIGRHCWAWSIRFVFGVAYFYWRNFTAPKVPGALCVLGRAVCRSLNKFANPKCSAWRDSVREMLTDRDGRTSCPL